MRGVTVQLLKETKTGVDDFGAPVYSTQKVAVDNVLIGEPSSEEILAATSLYGKRIRFMLGIPKGDTNDWVDKTVEWTDAYGRAHKLRTFGFPIVGVEALVPGPWHMKVRCEEIE